MKKIKWQILLLLIFLAVLSFRLYFSLTTHNFANDEAYFNLRQVQYILENKHVMSFDPLSYGGRVIVNTNLFHYVMAFFSFFIPLKLVLKIIPEIFMASLVVIVGLIARQLSRNRIASLCAALLSGFIPLVIDRTLNNVSEYSLVLPIMFFMFYSLIKSSKDKTYITYFVILSFILPLVSVSSFVFIFTLLFYVVLLVSEGVTLTRIKKEAILFALFLIFLIEFIIFKNVFLTHGLDFIWKNVPSRLLSTYFSEINSLILLYNLGIALLILGVVGISYGMFKEKNENSFLFVGVILSILFLLLLQLIDLYSGLIFLGVSSAILSSVAIAKFLQYIKISKLAKYRNLLILGILVFILVFSFIPSFINAINFEGISDKEIEALNWLKEETPEDSVIFAAIDEGHLITSVADRRNVMDSNFLLAPEPAERSKDVNAAFVTGSEAIALEIFKRYDVDYIYLSQNTVDRYGITEERYFKNELCFKEVVKNEKVIIYEIKC